MITQALFLSAGWFVISLLATLLGGTQLRRGHPLFSATWLGLVLLVGDVWAIQTFGLLPEFVLLTGLAFVLGLACIRWLPDWNAFGQVTWATTLLVTLLFLAYSFQVTAFSALSPLSFVIALVFFFIEMAALLLTLTHSYENLDVTCRIRWRHRIERIEPVPGYAPKVSLHVPAYDEPPEVVAETLRALAMLDYPDYEVLVVDNNTPHEQNWRPLEKLCQELGPRFRFFHLGHWPGYKSGALNFALAQTAPDAELIAAIDADYRVDPDFLRETVPAFSDPQVAFVQTPQDYRDFEGHPYFEPIYYSYKYFFDVSSAVRNEHNAIIFAGTMGLIRKSVLQEIGGWDEWCITEDAEASLRILKRGYQGLFYNRTFGRGLMPFSFDGLKKQRFRWCFGGIQILRKHWENLMPWATLVDPNNRLTWRQRYFYLTGGLQWFSDLFNLLLVFYLALVGSFHLLGWGVALRPLTGPLLALPAIFLVLGLGRFVWALRYSLQLSWRLALLSMYGTFSVGWVVVLACVQGLIKDKGVFFRTPKIKSDSQILKALSMAGWETAIALICLIIGLALILAQPRLQTYFLAILLLWQSSLYLAAPVYSLLSLKKQVK